LGRQTKELRWRLPIPLRGLDTDNEGNGGFDFI
jgi:hypothetical protein